MCVLASSVSRSGSTMTAGRALGFDRSTAAVFSFLMSMPIILAAALVKVPHAIAEAGVSVPLIVGVLTAAVFGWLAISVLLRFISRTGYGIYAMYRFALGALILGLIYTRGGW